MPASEKAAIRKAVRSRFDARLREEESRLICRHVLAWKRYQRAQVIGGYMPMRQEADVLPILQAALAQGKTLALPRCGAAPQMTFHQVKGLDELICGSYGLMEPAAHAPVIAPEEINLLLTPIEAITPAGLRLGKGGGYYDCLLSKCRMLTLGITLSWQWVEEMPWDAWDQPLTAAADKHGIHLF